MCLSRLWRDWRSALAIVKPVTRRGLASHRLSTVLDLEERPSLLDNRSFRARARSDPQDVPGNPVWGAPLIHGEPLKLGINIAESSVSKYLVRGNKPPSQTWRTFLENHAQQMVSIDFFTVPTIRFHVLYVFLVLADDRRRILHFNVTAHPSAEFSFLVQAPDCRERMATFVGKDQAAPFLCLHPADIGIDWAQHFVVFCPAQYRLCASR